VFDVSCIHADPPDPRRPGVLVVDDDPAVRDVLGFAMHQRGFKVWRAESGREALTLFWRQRERIDLVMLDVNMPGLDGPQTLIRLRKLTTRVHCCFVSGDLGRYTEQTLLDLGAKAVYRKPFMAADLAEKMHELVSSPQLNPSFREARSRVVRGRPSSGGKSVSVFVTRGQSSATAVAAH
jgi:CheY-like chemotaxis protein